MPGPKKVGGSRASKVQKQHKSTATVGFPKNKASSTPSKLLELPFELRNNIFRHVLVNDDPVKVQSHSSRNSSRHRFTMIPGSINASKQLRYESQRVFFEDNEFEITPQMLKLRSAIPLLSLRTMHRNVGLELSSVRVCQEIKKRFDGELFQLKASFNLSIDGGGLVISEQVYSGTYIGRAPSNRPPPGISVCGCDLADLMHWYNKAIGGNDIVDFLQNFKKRNRYRDRSYHSADMSRADDVVYRGRFCENCQRQGRSAIWF